MVTGGGFLQSLVRNKDGTFSIMGKAALTGLGAASIALPFMGGGGDDEDEGPVDQHGSGSSYTKSKKFLQRSWCWFRFYATEKIC